MITTTIKNCLVLLLPYAEPVLNWNGQTVEIDLHRRDIIYILLILPSRSILYFINPPIFRLRFMAWWGVGITPYLETVKTRSEIYTTDLQNLVETQGGIFPWCDSHYYELLFVIDRRSYTQAVVKLKPEKKFRPERDSNPWPLRYRCSALPNEVASHLGTDNIVSS